MAIPALRARVSFANATTLILALAAIKVVAHVVVAAAGRYGYFRDELYYVACSDHLALGYVDQPPLSIFVLALTRRLFGDSLVGLRLLPAVVGASVIVLTAAIARRLGGGRFAQLLAATGVLLAPVMLIQSLWFSMNAFDILFWTLSAYLIVLLIQEDDPKRWLTFGVVVGIGLLNKYSIGFLCIGLAAGLLLTPERRYLARPWLWLGAAIASALFLPHALWEVAHRFPSLEFMRNAALEKNAPITPWGFLLGQFDQTGKGGSVVWLMGLLFCFAHREGRRYRLFGWMYVAIFTVMAMGHAKAYYLSPICPALMAFGAVGIEAWSRERRWTWMKPLAFALVLGFGIVSVPFALPVLPVETFIRYQRFLGVTPAQEEREAMGALPQYYADMLGWETMVAAIAAAYDSLSPQEKKVTALSMNNYGEAGAIDFFGARYGLPKAICGHNNYWLWGPRGLTGEVVIRLGGDEKKMRESYADVRRAGVFHAEHCMPYEDNQPIYVCRKRHIPLTQVWAGFKHFE
jgi:hypothetical protein